MTTLVLGRTMRERFVIYLDKQSGHYVPGEDLSGHVSLQIQEGDHIKGILLRCNIIVHTFFIAHSFFKSNIN